MIKRYLVNLSKSQRRWITIALLFSISLLFGKSESDGTIAWSVLIMTLFGGLAFFLYGMDKMSEGMKKAAGNRMRNILYGITKNRFLGLFIGAFVTMVIQSSSATTVMLVSFVQAELMSYVQSIGIILGANIGTTVTAQLIAFKLTDYALAMIAIGFVLTVFAKNDSYKYFGEALLGFGILFFGMKLMSDAMKPLRDFEPFINTMKGLENPFMGLLIGAAFTALIQSSSAFTGIVIVLAQQGLLSLDAGIPLIFGANVGTCVTAGLASIGTTREAKRVALAHVLFNIGGVLIFIWFVPQLANLVRSISPAGAGTGITKLAMETPRQIANAHTIFNVGVALLFIPFTPLLAKFVMKIMPERESEIILTPVTWHIDKAVVSTPAIALELAQAEMGRMAKILNRMLKAAVHPLVSDEPLQDVIHPHLSLMGGIYMRENKIDFLEAKVSEYLMDISREELDKQQSKEVFALMSTVNDMESIGDTIIMGILPLLKKKKATGADFSDVGKEEIIAFHGKAVKLMARLRKAFDEQNFKKIKKLQKGDTKYRELEATLREIHLQRVQKERKDSVATHAVHMELLDMLKQINIYLAEIAKTLLRAKN